MSDHLLITGASGFIGQNLIAYLEESNAAILKRCVLLSSKKHSTLPTLLHNEYQFNKEIFDEFNITQVLHLGAFIPKNSTELNDINKNSSNILNTITLLNALPESIEKFIFCSTVDVYGVQLDTISESSIPNTNSIYGHSKLYCEKIIDAWCKEKNCTHQTLRLGHIYGIGEEKFNKFIPINIKKILKGERPSIYTTGAEVRSFLNVKDCVRLIIKSFELDSFKGPINIASSASYSIAQIVDIIIKEANSQLTPEVLNKDIPTRDLKFNNSKMVELLGSETIPFNEGIKEEIDYFYKILHH